MLGLFFEKLLLVHEWSLKLESRPAQNDWASVEWGYIYTSLVYDIMVIVHYTLSWTENNKFIKKSYSC